MKVTRNLTEGNIWRNLLYYAVPLLLSSLLSQAYSTVDGMIAGKCISAHALGAVSATGSFETLFRSLFGGFTAGFAIYISHLFGRKSFAAIKRDVLGMTVFVALLSVTISVLAVLFLDPVLDYLKVDDSLRADAAVYFVLYTGGYVIFFVNLVLVNVLHALGVTSFSFYVSLLSALLNIGGNLLSVLVFGMGVAGLALATLVSSGAATVIYVRMLRKVFREMDTAGEKCPFSFSGVRRSLRYSLPAAVQQLAFHGIAFLLAPSVNALGAAATTGYNVANRIYSLGTQGIWSTASAFACYTGQCVGEGSIPKLRRGVKVGFWLSCATTLPFVLAMVLFAGPAVSLFFPQGYDGEARAYALRYATVYLPFVYVQLVGHLLHSYMRSLGCVPTVLGITIVGSAARLLATLWLIPAMHMEAVFLGQIIGWSLDAAVSIGLYLCLYRSDRQLRRILGRAGGG